MKSLIRYARQIQIGEAVKKDTVLHAGLIMGFEDDMSNTPQYKIISVKESSLIYKSTRNEDVEFNWAGPHFDAFSGYKVVGYVK